MKNRSIFILASLMTVLPVGAQTHYDAVRNIGNELNGTARFVGMGGAMGALGADISVMGTNPAGIGLFRSNDVSLTFGFNKNIATSDFNGTVKKNDRTRASFDQIGFVYSSKVGNQTALRYLNFGFNYHKAANFNRQFSSGGNLDGHSLTWQMADMLMGATYGGGDYYYGAQGDLDALFDAENPYTSRGYYGTPFLSSMGVRMDLVYNPYRNPNAGEGVTGEPFLIQGWNGIDGNYFSREQGGIDVYDFNVAFNIKDRFYVGVTLGVYDIDYTRYSSYSENLFVDAQDDAGFLMQGDGGFTLENWFRTEGSGFDLKLGAILRPFEYSPFRIGFAVHTPIWYSLTDSYTASLNSDVYYETANIPDGDGVNGTENLADYYSGDGSYFLDQKLTTPWKFNVSLGTTVSDVLAVGAEYEYANYASSKYHDLDGYELSAVNDAVDKYLDASHTFRVGMEAKLSENFSLRAGYNYVTSPIKETSVRYTPDIQSVSDAQYIYYDETRTDPEYFNLKSRNTLTVGLGYRGRLFYADVAYKYDFYKADFYLFDDYLYESNGSDDYIVGRNPAAKVNNDRHQLLFTMGVRF